MKRTAFLLTVGVILLALGLFATRAAYGQESVAELPRLRAENTALKAEIAAFKVEVAALKRVTDLLHKEVASLKNELTEANSRLRATGEAVPSLVLPPASPTGSPQDKWSGFRGLKWGTNIADAPGMVLIEDHPDAKYYRREGEKLAIGAAQLTEVTYGFYKGRFHYVSIQAEGFSAWVALRDAVFATYGKGYQPNQFIERWCWGVVFPQGVKDVSMGIQYSEITKKTRLHMSYVPIDAEEKADKAERAKGAKKDF